MDNPQVSPAHRQLHSLAGNWVGQEKIYPSPWHPHGAAAVGKVKNKAALDGLAVVQHYEQEMGGTVVFRGHGIFTFDGAADQHMLYWFDSVSQVPSIFRGGFTGNLLTLASQSPQGHVRASWDVTLPEAYSYRMDVSGDGKQWVPLMEAEYRLI